MGSHMKKNIPVSDNDFIQSLYNFNINARVSVIEKLIELFKLDVKMSEADQKSIFICIFENYIAMSEMILMLIIAMKKVRREGNKTFFETYTNVCIKESIGSVFSSKKLLKDVSGKEPEDLMQFFGFGSFQTYYDSLNDQKKCEFHKQFGNDINKIEKDFISEFQKVINALRNIVNSRIANKNGQEFPLYKLLNKIKHGYQIIDIQGSDQLSIFLKSENDWEDYSINCNVDFAEMLLYNANIITQTMKTLIQYYTLSMN